MPFAPATSTPPLVEAQIDGQARAHNIPREKVIRDVLLAQQPNKRFASVEELGAFVGFPRLRRGRLNYGHCTTRGW